MRKMKKIHEELPPSIIGREKEINKTHEIIYTDHNGKILSGHDGSPILLADGRKQFFLHNGKAVIHDGMPIKLSDGKTQFFDEEGRAMWPVDAKSITSSSIE